MAHVEEAKVLLQSKDVLGAEFLLKEALLFAQNFAGSRSPLAGFVFLELHDLYEKQGRQEEASQAWSIVRDILRAHHH